MLARLLQFSSERPWAWPMHNMLEQFELGLRVRIAAAGRRSRPSARLGSPWRRSPRLADIDTRLARPPPVELSRMPAVALVRNFLNASQALGIAYACSDVYLGTRLPEAWGLGGGRAGSLR